jgi:hypothetical protein
MTERFNLNGGYGNNRKGKKKNGPEGKKGTVEGK